MTICYFLYSKFAKKDLGPLHYFLRVEARHQAHGIHLLQSKYNFEILLCFVLDQVKLVSTPLASRLMLSMEDG